MNHKTGRNDPCPCGSGKKYKKCCLDKVTGVGSVSWDIDKVGAMSTEEIFKKLDTIGIQTDQDQFLQDVNKFYSASALANHWLRPIGLDIADVDFVHYASIILWEKLAPGTINDEMLDDMIQNGYLEFEKGKSKIGCQCWLTVWEHIKPRFTSDMKSITDAESVFTGVEKLSNWTQDLEMELGDADLHEDRIKYCREFTEMFPESPDSIILNMKMAEAEGYFNIGQRDKAETMFSDLQKDYPVSAQVYCRWGDLFVFRCNPDFVPDYEKAEKIYRMALDRNLDEKGDVMDRIRDMKKIQKKKK